MRHAPSDNGSTAIDRDVHVDEKPGFKPFQLLGLRDSILLKRIKGNEIQKGTPLTYFEADNVLFRRKGTVELLDGDFFRIHEILQSETFQTFLRDDCFRETTIPLL